MLDIAQGVSLHDHLIVAKKQKGHSAHNFPTLHHYDITVWIPLPYSCPYLSQRLTLGGGSPPPPCSCPVLCSSRPPSSSSTLLSPVLLSLAGQTQWPARLSSTEVHSSSYYSGPLSFLLVSSAIKEANTALTAVNGSWRGHNRVFLTSATMCQLTGMTPSMSGLLDTTPTNFYAHIIQPSKV